jgi:hypothetical protein
MRFVGEGEVKAAPDSTDNPFVEAWNGYGIDPLHIGVDAGKPGGGLIA